MKKNLYYQTMFRRNNIFKAFLLGFFSSFASYARLLLEVFIRRDFGERYFQLSSAMTVAVILLLMPFIPTSSDDLQNIWRSVSFSHFWSWYIFVALFVYVSIQRYKEVRRNPSVFDLAKFSLSSGKINPFFFQIVLSGKKPDRRFVETILEPAAFFIAGLLLWVMHQRLGILLTVCSVIYAVSYMAAYQNGDDFIMDKIDEMICNAELKKAFVDGMDEDQTRGFQFIGRKPVDAEMRKQLLPLLIDDGSGNDESLDVK